LGLAGREHDKVERYSRGMKQRLHLARGLLNDPDVLFLDEPTIGSTGGCARSSGAGPGLADGGKTIFLTTHYMFEADAICDRVAVIKKAASWPRAPRAASSSWSARSASWSSSRCISPLDLDRLQGLAWRELRGRAERELASSLHPLRAARGRDDAAGKLLDVSLAQCLVSRGALEDAYVALIVSSHEVAR